jgi:hypothetical protein
LASKTGGKVRQEALPGCPTIHDWRAEDEPPHPARKEKNAANWKATSGRIVRVSTSEVPPRKSRFFSGSRARASSFLSGDATF